MADMAEGLVVTAWMLGAMLVPAGLLWTAMRVYDLVMDHRDRQRRRRVRRAMRAAQTTIPLDMAERIAMLPILEAEQGRVIAAHPFGRECSHCGHYWDMHTCPNCGKEDAQ